MIKNYIGCIITILVLTSCEDTVDLALQTRESDLLVVEGILTNQKINHRIKLTRPHREINGIPLPATGAIVTISEGESRDGEFVLGDNSYVLTEFPPGSGEYYTEPFRAVFGRIYVLQIAYDGRGYFAFDSSVPAEPLPPLSLERASENDAVFRLNLFNTGTEPHFIDHFITWENSGFCSDGNSCEGKVVFYDLKTVDVHETFKPDKTDFLFPVNSVIIRTKYSVNESYKSFLRSVLSETEWRGGIFDIQRANAPTNLSEGAIGYFTVSTVVSDTTIVIE